MQNKAIPKEHSDVMTRALGLKDADPLPDDVVRCYWDFKLMCDRVDAGHLAPQTLALVAFLGNGMSSKRPVVTSKEESVPLKEISNKQKEIGEKLREKDNRPRRENAALAAMKANQESVEAGAANG